MIEVTQSFLKDSTDIINLVILKTSLTKVKNSPETQQSYKYQPLMQKIISIHVLYAPIQHLKK